jgi:hypothetical protein
MRTGKLICENVHRGNLSEDDRQTNADALALFKLIENDLKFAATHDEIQAAAKEAMALVNNEWFKHLIASNEP